MNEDFNNLEDMHLSFAKELTEGTVITLFEGYVGKKWYRLLSNGALQQGLFVRGSIDQREYLSGYVIVEKTDEIMYEIKKAAICKAMGI
jgi:hypothetical protein